VPRYHEREKRHKQVRGEAKQEEKKKGIWFNLREMPEKGECEGKKTKPRGPEGKGTAQGATVKRGPQGEIDKGKEKGGKGKGGNRSQVWEWDLSKTKNNRKEKKKEKGEVKKKTAGGPSERGRLFSWTREGERKRKKAKCSHLGSLSQLGRGKS